VVEENCIIMSFMACTLRTEIIRMFKSRMKYTGHVAPMARTHSGFWWESRKETDQVRLSRRWVDNIKMDLRETGWGGMGWIDLTQDRDQWRALVNTVMNVRVT
jgi:hypothetical protein